MGIYDREYVRVGPRSPSGVGALRLLSFNTWLIIINVAVFVLDALLFSSGFALAVNMGEAHLTRATQEQLERAVETPVEGPSMTLPGSRARLIIDGRGDSIAAADLADARLVRTQGQDLAVFVGGSVYQVIGERRFTGMAPMQALFHFSSAKLFFGLEFWRLIGFQFLHANLTHLLLNMIGLYFFGGMVEGYLGRKRYAAFYLVCGIFGGAAYMLLNLLGQIPGLPRIPGLLFNDAYTPLVGASAGVFGVLMAGAFIAPRAIILVFFILPMRLATAIYLFIGIAAINLLSGGANAGGDAAHLGGAIAGAYFIRHTHLLRDFFDFFGSSRKARRTVAGDAGAPARKAAPPAEPELDRILGKIATQGIHSLSEDERRTLRRATEARRR